ncbi:hypothetical protein B0H17DRAFT_1056085 [Mycena rosella]|uniref:Uncharacterized protein n=1 Tax=Mycena rosella TaxID=1033263 RepID=A0AAD7GLQ6_MYCRO|nr:hypothetical protein B0H17DRAFT_1056085 [Mycena rosella]
MVENTTRVFTNGSAEYCTTQQEDNATLNALMRGALFRLVDFARCAPRRTGIGSLPGRALWRTCWAPRRASSHRC